MTVHHAKAIDPSGFKPKPAQALRFFIPALLYQQIGEALADIVVSGIGTHAQFLWVAALGQRPVGTGNPFRLC
jgi:hypothetical protein